MVQTEEIVDLLPDGLQIFQSRSGYRYSIDPFLLCAFARIPLEAKVADLGSGSGVIPLLLVRKASKTTVVGIELQDDLVERSRRSVALNDLEDRIKIIHADVRNLSGVFDAGSFDLVLTNPPYRPTASGRLSRVDERARARHELAGGLAEFLGTASFLLKGRGRFYIIYLAERLAELLAEMRLVSLEPKRLRMVHSRDGDDARLVLVEGCKHARPGLIVEAPLIIYQGTGRDYSEEILGIYEKASVRYEL